MSRRDGAPSWRIAMRRSLRRISRTRSPPLWPNAASPHSDGRPMQTAWAPSASALTMSKPRRKPLSTKTGMRPPTASTISGRASIVARPRSPNRPPWLETMAFDEIPVHVRRAEAGCAIEIDAVEIGPAGDEFRQAPAVAVAAVPPFAAPQPGRGFPVGLVQHIDGQRDDRRSRPFRPPDQRLGDLPLVGRIELKPYRGATGGNRVFNRGGGAGRQDLQVVAGLRRLGDGDLPVRVKGAVATGRRDDDRTVIAGAEEFGRHVDRADIDEPAWAQLEVEEALAIGAQRHLVVGASYHVAEMRRRQILLRGRLEAEDVEPAQRRKARGINAKGHREEVYFRTADFFGGAVFFRGALF